MRSVARAGAVRLAPLRDEERARRLHALPKAPGVHARAQAISAVLEPTGYPGA
jgi:hypothetical protein